MVEEVKLEEKTYTSNEEKKKLTVGFYVWNLNFYLISILTFSSLWIIIPLYFIINSFVIKSMFGFTRFNRIIFWDIVLTIAYIYTFDGFKWQYLLLAITILINIAYYLIVIKDGEVYTKLIKQT